MTTTYDIGNPGPGLEQALVYGRVFKQHTMEIIRWPRGKMLLISTSKMSHYQLLLVAFNVQTAWHDKYMHV
jgi:hypothetical protein